MHAYSVLIPETPDSRCPGIAVCRVKNFSACTAEESKQCGLLLLHGKVTPMSRPEIERILDSAELAQITDTERILHFFLRRLHVRIDASELRAAREILISIVQARQEYMKGKPIVHL